MNLNKFQTEVLSAIYALAEKGTKNIKTFDVYEHMHDTRKQNDRLALEHFVGEKLARRLAESWSHAVFRGPSIDQILSVATTLHKNQDIHMCWPHKRNSEIKRGYGTEPVFVPTDQGKQFIESLQHNAKLAL